MIWQPHTWTPWYLSYWQKYFFPIARQPLVGQGVLVMDASRSHSDTPHLVGLLWTSDQPYAKTATWQQTTLTRDRHPWPWRDSNPQSQQASGHWDRYSWWGCRHEQQPRTKSDIPFEGFECYLLFSWTESDMILQPSTDRVRKLASP
jgi:hypothetical protein